MHSTRILFVARPDLLTNPGGDTTQIVETRRHLEALDISVDLHLAGDPADGRRLVAYDLVHCFNVLLAHQFEGVVTAARSQGVPVALSPIYWDMEPYERGAGAVPAWKRMLLAVLNRIPGVMVRAVLQRRLKSVAFNAPYRAHLRDVLSSVDLLLPNSRAEAALIRERFRCMTPSFVVPNGCRTVSSHDGPPAGAPVRYILCVGRIERRKNQLRLIEAVSGFGLPLVLLGNVNLAEGEYWSACRRRAEALGVELLHLPGRGWEDVWRWYRHAEIHVQPSWFETPGLSSLEAAAAGCPIVCTSVGSAEEYFGGVAEYCDPTDVRSIRAAMVRMFGRIERMEGRAFDASRYSWSSVADATAAAYAEILGRTVGRKKGLLRRAAKTA